MNEIICVEHVRKEYKIHEKQEEIHLQSGRKGRKLLH